MMSADPEATCSVEIVLSHRFMNGSAYKLSTCACHFFRLLGEEAGPADEKGRFFDLRGFDLAFEPQKCLY